MDPPNEFQPLIDEIFRAKVRWARQESPERKFMDGLELFEEALVRMRGGIRARFSRFTPADRGADADKMLAAALLPCKTTRVPVRVT